MRLERILKPEGLPPPLPRVLEHPNSPYKSRTLPRSRGGTEKLLILWLRVSASPRPTSVTRKKWFCVVQWVKPWRRGWTATYPGGNAAR